MADTALEQVREDANAALKAGDKGRAQALRMILDALQKGEKAGTGDDEVTVLRRERKRRLEAAEAFRNGGRAEQAAAEDSEAELISGYLPAELSDDELDALVASAVEESGATEMREMGKAMGALIPKVGGRADGGRVSAAVKKHLSG